MKSKLNTQSIAVLAATASAQVGFAALALIPNTEKESWCQLLPAGHFSAVDGRPHDVESGKWFIDATIAQRLIDTALSARNDLVLDYEHQTLNADKNGQPAPAAGWFKDMQWREGSGLWIKVNWTANARDYIDNGEYRYLSAVFPYDVNTGEPLMIHSAALVNRAGLDGLQVAALSTAATLSQTSLLSNQLHNKTSIQEIFAMNETLRKLLAKLGIEVAADAELTDAQSTAALSALDLLSTQAGKISGLETNIASLKANIDKGVDLSRFVPIEPYNALVIENAALKAGDAKKSAKQLIDDGQASGKVLAAEVDYLAAFAEQQGVTALKSMLDGRPALVALNSKQTDETHTPDTKDTSVARLSEEDKEAARLLGKTNQEYAALKAEHA